MVIVYPGNEPMPLIPSLANEQLSRNVTDLVYERLAEIGMKMNTIGDAGFTPRLAKSWTWSRDSMSIAFSIDPRARWHDGQPVRASDVVYTFGVNKDPKTGSLITSVITNIDSVTARDSLTAVAWFHRRTPEQFYDIAYQNFIIPEHVFRNIPHDKLGTSDAVKHPIGSGQFRFVRWEPGVRVELIADTAHYRGRPKLDRIIISLVTDVPTSITQLLTGQADFVDVVPPDLIPRIDSSGQAELFKYPGNAFAYMGLQTRDPKRPGQPHPIFGDRMVRRAISMALDRQAMLRNVFDTLGTLGSGPFTRPFADTTITLLPFDRAHAAALLDSAGWRVGADGIRSKNGRPLAFSVLVPISSAPRQRYAVLIQEQLKGVGARVNVESADFSNFVARMDTRNFDAIINAGGADPSPSGIKQNWTSESLARGGQNYTNYSNPLFDALVDSASRTLDPERARGYYHRAYQTIVDDAPAVWLYDILSVGGKHKRIRPVGIRADTWWANLPEWWIPANERIDRDRIGLRAPQP